MALISSPIDRIKDHYTVVVVGSGYGGAIAASRLSRAGQAVCVLERGREFQPGEYPDTQSEAVSALQVDSGSGHTGSRTALYDLRVNKDIDVFMGCGLGGTSLVNANVAIKPDPRVFDDPEWPEDLRRDVATLLDDGYKRAEEMLKPASYPPDFPSLHKLEALRQSAAFLQANFYRLPVTVNFGVEGANHVGVEQHKCVLCGDCVTGCNYSAKNTLIMNYLPDARNYGAEIYTRVAVRSVERKGDRFVVRCRILDTGREIFDAPDLAVSADIVILAAGALGSTEILLRSKQAGLAVSEKVGHAFTGNGDVLGIGYNNDREINGVGYGSNSPEGRDPVGPTITGIIDLRNQADMKEGLVLEEGAIPGALAPLLPVVLANAGHLVGVETAGGVAELIRKRSRELDGLVRGAYHGAAHNTQVYLVMSHDSGDGVIELENDRARIRWPGVGAAPVFKRANEELEEATRPLEGTYVRNPAWSGFTSNNLITVHPLGGCVMGADAGTAVVNHKGQVFSGQGGTETHEGLYVCDGAVIPLPLGVNPFLTISALAERMCTILARDRGWHIDYTLPSQPKATPQPLKPGLEFTETMRGYISPSFPGDFEKSYADGKEKGLPFQFTLTIATGDVNAMLTDPQHQARAVGTVEAPMLSQQALTVTNGTFNLFVTDPGRTGARQMWYRLPMTSVEGKTCFMTGFKEIHDDGRLDVWPDTTTLYITIHEGENVDGKTLGSGILRISPADFSRQLTTIQVTNAADTAERLAIIARFSRFFAGTLFDVYGGIFAKPRVFNPDAPPRKKRPLRADAPEVFAVPTGDGVQIRLMRYRGGTKGPVILSPGLGVSSLIFSMDTIETNLLEYIFAHGYDVWLLDYRAGIDLPSASLQSTGDVIAARDYPAAVDTVLKVTGAATVQVVAHCFGSATFFMAMLSGLRGVRSAVASQVAAHMKVPPSTAIKTGLYFPSLLGALGVDSLTAYVDTHAAWQEQLFDKALKLYPVPSGEECDNPVCRRITFMYGPLYNHARLNSATHDALHEMFGIANMSAFEHLGRMVNAGRLVDSAGEDIYLPHLDRLAIPICFIHGADNRCFLPESTEITLQLLSEANGQHLYTRHTVPGYGHIDCIFGKDAVNDVYPFILKHLEATA